MEVWGKKEVTGCMWRARHARKKWWSHTRGETNTWSDMMMRPATAHPRVQKYIHTSEGLDDGGWHTHTHKLSWRANSVWQRHGEENGAA